MAERRFWDDGSEFADRVRTVVEPMRAEWGGDVPAGVVAERLTAEDRKQFWSLAVSATLDKMLTEADAPSANADEVQS